MTSKKKSAKMIVIGSGSHAAPIAHEVVAMNEKGVTVVAVIDMKKEQPVDDDRFVREIDSSHWRFDLPHHSLCHAMGVAFLECQDVIDREEELIESNVFNAASAVNIRGTVTDVASPVGNITAPNGRRYQVAVTVSEITGEQVCDAAIVQTGFEVLALDRRNFRSKNVSVKESMTKKMKDFEDRQSIAAVAVGKMMTDEALKNKSDKGSQNRTDVN